MGTRLRAAARFATLVALTFAPVLTGSGASPEIVPVDSVRRAGDLPAPVDPLHQEVRLLPVGPPQQVEPQTTLVWKADRNRKIRLDGPRGGRVWTASALASHDLPQAALTAYKNAAAETARTDPACQIPWTLLAGIGRVESDHGRYGGSVLSSDGVSRPKIIGVALNGRGPVAAVHDTDHGVLDGDKVWDRAVGPMQFIPSTWAYAGRDGDGDGRMNPHDIDDTALAAAAYLCSGSGSLLVDANARSAIFRYNPSDYYVALVQAFERGYRTGVFVMPSPPPPPNTDDRPRHHRKHKAESTAATKSTTKTRATSDPQDRPTPGSGEKPSSSPKPTPKPTPKPSPSPSPKPSPSPSPSPPPSVPPPSVPPLDTATGTLATCGSGWCLGSLALDLGPAGQLSVRAAHDYDGSGSAGTNAEELSGLVGASVTVTFRSGSTPAVVYVIAGEDYRFADGSFA